MHDARPYSTALPALQEKYGYLGLLVQSEIGAILNSPIIRISDVEAFDECSRSVLALVGLLLSLEGPNGSELRCGSHVDRLPVQYTDGFIEHCNNRGILIVQANQINSLLDLSTCLQSRPRAKCMSERSAVLHREERPQIGKEHQSFRKVIFVYLSTKLEIDSTPRDYTKEKRRVNKPKPYCAYCTALWERRGAVNV